MKNRYRGNWSVVRNGCGTGVRLHVTGAVTTHAGGHPVDAARLIGWAQVVSDRHQDLPVVAPGADPNAGELVPATLGVGSMRPAIASGNSA